LSRIDKWHPAIGTFRAPSNAVLSATSGPSGVTDLNRILCVGLNSSGRVIKAASVAACSGIIIATKPFAAGEMIDVFTLGEVAELDGNDIQGGVAATAGQKLYYDATASRLTATAPGVGVNGFYVGQVALDPIGNATRLILRATPVQL
jgi:hypothetical protein